MKKAIILLMALVATVCSVKAEDKVPVVVFEETTHDFGMIKEEGGPVSCIFTFINEGEAPLVIISASAQCGCTRPSFPQSPINPGKKGEIKVTFHPQGRPGEFIKEVKVKTNDKKHRTTKLKIMGVVIPYQEE
ncbi:MAG: DUF1573 domain-containing protein [Muribaculaceae bacterium]|nr:DUF1573 domain-containing protein [Muribaculaceae bacterium]